MKPHAQQRLLVNKLEVAVYLRASDTNETSDGRFALYPLEHRADSEPGNTAGGHGLGGENPSAPEDERYVCAFCQQHEIFANYTEVMVSDDYPELVKLFGERVAEQAEKTRIALNGPKIQGIPNSAITAEDCEQVSYQEDIRGKVVVIRPEVLRREYRHATCQLQLCTSGSGAYPNSRGTACYCTELYSGQRARFERSDILGVIAPEDLPKWAKHYLELRQAEKERNSRDREGR